MSVRPTLLKDLRRTAIMSHQNLTGTGNYNRFAPLSPRGRLPSQGKRLRENLAPEENPPKAPRVDANLVFDQLKAQDVIFQEAKSLLDNATKTLEDCCSAEDGAYGTALFNITKVLSLLFKSQENLTSALVDSFQVNKPTPDLPPPVVNPHAPGPSAPHRDRSSSNARYKAPPPPISEEEAARRKVRQVLREAEKKSILFNLDLGPVPTMNKETISRKVTLALSNKARSGEHDYHIGDAEDVIDDVLSCAKLEFLGTTTRKFFNNAKKDDPRNNKMCTLPVRMDFKDRETRIQAEISMRKICKVSCSTPYPRRLRTMLDAMVKEGKVKAPGCFIRTRVNVDKLTLEAHAKRGESWEDLHLLTAIPIDILDRQVTNLPPPPPKSSSSPVVTLENMDEDESINLS